MCCEMAGWRRGGSVLVGSCHSVVVARVGGEVSEADSKAASARCYTQPSHAVAISASQAVKQKEVLDLMNLQLPSRDVGRRIREAWEDAARSRGSAEGSISPRRTLERPIRSDRSLYIPCIWMWADGTAGYVPTDSRHARLSSLVSGRPACLTRPPPMPEWPKGVLLCCDVACGGWCVRWGSI